MCECQCGVFPKHGRMALGLFIAWGYQTNETTRFKPMVRGGLMNYLEQHPGKKESVANERC